MKTFLLMAALFSLNSFSLELPYNTEQNNPDSETRTIFGTLENLNQAETDSFDDDCDSTDRFCEKRPNYCRCMKVNGCAYRVMKLCGFK